MRAQLDADLALVLKLLPPIVIETTTPKSFRELLRGLAAASGAFPLPRVPSLEDITVKGAAGSLKARVYRPTAEVSPDPSSSSFTAEGVSAATLKRMTARSSGGWQSRRESVVISVDYRLAPETLGFPGAFAMTRLRPRPRCRNSDRRVRKKCAADWPCRGRRRGRDCRCDSHRVSGQKPSRRGAAPDLSRNGHGRAFTPMRKENSRFPSRTENADSYFTSFALMRWCANFYLPDKRSSFDWRASPLRARSLIGVAPAVVCTAEFDPLRDEGEAYADALLAAGVATYRRHGMGMTRGYFEMGDSWPAALGEAVRVRLDFKNAAESQIVGIRRSRGQWYHPPTRCQAHHRRRSVRRRASVILTAMR